MSEQEDDDPLVRMARESALARAVDDWLTIQINLQQIDSPFLAMLKMARDEAIDALAALADADPEKPSEIRRLQNQITVFRDHIRFIKKILERGRLADKILSQDERVEIYKYVGREDMEELGITEEELNDA